MTPRSIWASAATSASMNTVYQARALVTSTGLAGVSADSLGVSIATLAVLPVKLFVLPKWNRDRQRQHPDRFIDAVSRSVPVFRHAAGDIEKYNMISILPHGCCQRGLPPGSGITDLRKIIQSFQ